MKKLSFIVYICAFVAISPAFGYLDPGSGSLLLSSVVAVFASIIYFFKNIFYSLLNIRSSGFGGLKSLGNSINGGGQLKRSLNKSIVIYCESNQYYNTFAPILRELDALSHPYTYLTSSQEDPAFRANHKGSLEFIGQGNKAYTRLNSLVCDILLLTTPGLNVLQIKKTRSVKHYCHIVHSLSPMTYRTFGLDYFDSVLVVNEIQANFVRQIESIHGTKGKHIAIVGSTYLDELDCLYKSIDSSKTAESSTKQTILISPSWGKESLLSKYGLKLLEPLAKDDFHIIIRPHPQSLIAQAESSNIKELQNALSCYKNVEWDIGKENVYSFARADLMISDFSSVIFDFALLAKKPILTMEFSFDSAGYDIADLGDLDNFYTFKKLEQIGAKISINDLSNIAKIARTLLDSADVKKALDSLYSEIWQHRGNAGKMATKELLKIESHLLSSKLDRYAFELSRLRELDSMIGTFSKESKTSIQTQTSI